MPSRKTYKMDKTTGALIPHKHGEYDGDGDRITTYRKNSKGELVLDIDGRLEVNGKEVKKYKKCKAENYYRRDVRGTYTADQVDKFRQELKEVPKTSALTAELEQQREETQRKEGRSERADAAQARQLGSRGESSRTSTRVESSRQPSTASGDRPRRVSPQGRALTRRQIAEQVLEEVDATARYHEPGLFPERQPFGSHDLSDKPPSYKDHKKDYKDERFADGTAGPVNQKAPPYKEKPLSFAGPTGLTPKLGKRLPKDTKPPTSWDGRYDPNAPDSYSSGEFKGRRGNHLTSSDEENPRRYTSGSDNVFRMSDLEKDLPSEGETKSTSLSKPRASSRNRSSTKVPESKPPKKTSAEETSARKPRTNRPLSSDSSFGDSENSPPSFLSQARHRGTGDQGSRRRETSTDRNGKGKEKEKEREKKSGRDPAKSSSSRKRHGSLDPDSLYGS
ncbi:hypothetical protein BOTCAL_0213g00010 [Botryotinia calthae]|uniref:Uncharacterized protein n=1 Tax=Botryotinia calthae TaxID=38488 RepID=A0A4Y8CYK8_9HELO|nr:hypothetical protein BOTCAL_0213g00010 [Botryotinia calthae]